MLPFYDCQPPFWEKMANGPCKTGLGLTDLFQNRIRSHFYNDCRKVKCPPELKHVSFYFQRNVTFIRNQGVRDTILNLTLKALAPEFEDFEPEDFELWFQVNLVPVMASFHPGSLVVIPRDISCASYAAM